MLADSRISDFRICNWQKILSLHNQFSFFKEILFIPFHIEGKGGRETLIYDRNINWLPLAHPQLGTWPTTQACALTGNQTGDPSIHRLVPNPLSHTNPVKAQPDFFLSFFLSSFIVVQVQFSAFSPHPSPTPQLSQPPSPVSTPACYCPCVFIISTRFLEKSFDIHNATPCILGCEDIEKKNLMVWRVCSRQREQCVDKHNSVHEYSIWGDPQVVCC